MAAFVFTFVFFVLIRCNVAFYNYCDKNIFDANGDEMAFTKEANYREFAVVGSLKALHCCAKEYQTIEWYKEDKVYPWPLDVSTMLLFPASANQTIYSQAVKQTDEGNYKCILRNDSIIHSHTVKLYVLDKAPDDPQITYLSDDTKIFIGDKLRLYCEAFVGNVVDLPDAHSEVYWYKTFPNGTRINDIPSRIKQIKTEQEDEQTIGSYLVIDEVLREDFGDYVCVITKPGMSISRIVNVNEKISEVEFLTPTPLPVAKLIFILTGILTLFVLIVIIYLKFGLEWQVRIKDTFSPLEDGDGKKKDVLVVYSCQDAEIALGVLVTTLEGKFGYSCDSKELSFDVSTWLKELSLGEKYRRIAVLVSPALLKGSWDSDAVLGALKELRKIGPKMLCVSLKDFPKNEMEVKDSNGETLRAVIRSLNVILWERKEDEKLWNSLRLRLPPKRNVPQGTDTRLCYNSQESVEDFRV
ncbi:uncharacterized protein LOC130444478 isoform X1 [Diorhabda sublineata]|uniref:uncharacterized protein LOC130444478 isoform X1 n=2 Tax=Diorhabda sublineata TaxID=1163346 RepID=UPI0024E11EC8|nr:uncharacterized protein LOC130444478 isoform X1 [Diorhabda sublineata]